MPGAPSSVLAPSNNKESARKSSCEISSSPTPRQPGKGSVVPRWADYSGQAARMSGAPVALMSGVRVRRRGTMLLITEVHECGVVAFLVFSGL